jgi:hypothetical protein
VQRRISTRDNLHAIFRGRPLATACLCSKWGGNRDAKERPASTLVGKSPQRTLAICIIVSGFLCSVCRNRRATFQLRWLLFLSLFFTLQDVASASENVHAPSPPTAFSVPIGEGGGGRVTRIRLRYHCSEQISRQSRRR